MDSTSSNSNEQSTVPGQNQDYGDKAMDALEEKAGLPQNEKINEKITDAARDKFEEKTGIDVPEKFSN